MNMQADSFDLEYTEGTDPGTTPAAPVIKTPSIPDKYQNKSIDDIIQMHQEAERKASRLSTEVGELRNRENQLLTRVTEQAKPEVKRELLTPDSLLTDPNAAISQAISQSDVAHRVDSTAQRLENLERNLSQREFTQKYPDFVQDLNDPEFQAWASANPTRLKLLQHANANLDFSVANDLWDMWDEHKQLKDGRTKVAKAAKVKAASVVRDTPADSVRQGKVIYSRAKIKELISKVADDNSAAKAKWEDPTFQADLVAAYAEGRVV